jgi:aminoglycoside phosphotransferase (APT) family kinase protein
MSNAGSEDQSVNPRIGVSVTRDLAETAAILGEWMQSRVPGADRVTVKSLRPPRGGGGSSETLLVTFEVAREGSLKTEECVLRIKPTAFRLFLRENFEQQYALLTYLQKHTQIPVPAMHLFEANPSYLGAPFWIMEKVEGAVPSG